MIPAYGITIMKAQGMTIGAREVIKKCVIKLSDSISMEAKNLGLGYNALSRICEFFDFALHKRIPWERLESSHTNEKQKRRGKAFETFRTANDEQSRNHPTGLY